MPLIKVFFEILALNEHPANRANMPHIGYMASSFNFMLVNTSLGV